MARAKKEMEEINRLAQLEQENLLLKQKLEAQEALNASRESLTPNLTSEMNKIRNKGRVGGNEIKVGDKADHMNVTLWTPWGAMKGPMHPDNAIQALYRFANYGILLSAERPTPQKIEAWANSPAGKAYRANEEAKRSRKDKTRKSGVMDRLATEIAKMNNTTVEAMNRVLKPNEVRPLSEVR